MLGQKLALLMALVEASRSSELHALDVRYRVFKAGLSTFVQAWVSQPSQCIPTTADAVHSFTAKGGQLTPEHEFGGDPL